MNFLSTMIFGMILGMKHSLEPDHIIAVSTIVTETKKVKVASYLGLMWGIGHSMTILIVGTLLVMMKLTIPPHVADHLEVLVGFMLVYFGIRAWFGGLKHAHTPGHHHHDHDHNHSKRFYRRSAFMGFVHGISGSASIVLMTMLAVDQIFESFLFILIFGIGTSLSMVVSTSLIGLPFVMTTKKSSFHEVLTRITAGISVVFGVYYVLTNLM